MPAVSKSQNRWVNSPSGHAALGEKGVKEWNAGTKGKKLPEHKRKKHSDTTLAPGSPHNGPRHAKTPLVDVAALMRGSDKG